jgi:hypothetical protein
MVEPMGAARRLAGQNGNLLEGQSAPDLGDEDLALFKGESLQGRRDGGAIQTGSLGRDEPRRLAQGSLSLMVSSPNLSTAGAECTVTDDAIQPRERRLWGRFLDGELDERFLDNIFWRGAPLPRVQHQRRRVSVHQTSQLLRSHYITYPAQRKASQKIYTELAAS